MRANSESFPGTTASEFIGVVGVSDSQRAYMRSTHGKVSVRRITLRIRATGNE